MASNNTGGLSAKDKRVATRLLGEYDVRLDKLQRATEDVWTDLRVLFALRDKKNRVAQETRELAERIAERDALIEEFFPRLCNNTVCDDDQPDAAPSNATTASCSTENEVVEYSGHVLCKLLCNMTKKQFATDLAMRGLRVRVPTSSRGKLISPICFSFHFGDFEGRFLDAYIFTCPTTSKRRCCVYSPFDAFHPFEWGATDFIPQLTGGLLNRFNNRMKNDPKYCDWALLCLALPYLDLSITSDNMPDLSAYLVHDE